MFSPPPVTKELDMIHNKKRNDLQEIFDAMEKTCYDFYLTGSRFFETHHPDSDYDFFVQEDETRQDSIDTFLCASGFECLTDNWSNDVTMKKKETTFYEDRETVFVYQHTYLPIHIQIVLDAALKQKIQEVMLETMKDSKLVASLNGLSKPYQIMMWDFVFSFYRILEEKKIPIEKKQTIYFWEHEDGTQDFQAENDDKARQINQQKRMMKNIPFHDITLVYRLPDQERIRLGTERSARIIRDGQQFVKI